MKVTFVLAVLLTLGLFTATFASAYAVQKTPGVAIAAPRAISPTKSPVIATSQPVPSGTDNALGGFTGKLYKGSTTYKIAFSYVPVPVPYVDDSIAIGLLTVWDSQGNPTYYKMVQNDAITNPTMMSFWLLPGDATIGSYDNARENRVGVLTYADTDKRGDQRTGKLLFHVHAGESPYVGLILAGDASTESTGNPETTTKTVATVTPAKTSAVAVSGNAVAVKPVGIRASAWGFIKRIFSR